MSTTPLESVRTLQPLKGSAAAKVKTAAMESRPAAAEAAAAPAGEHPGVERWPVKTGTDADVAKVGQNAVKGELLGKGIVDTTIEEMLKLPRASDMPSVTSSFPKNSHYQNHRAAPTETTIWRLTALVKEGKLEQDGDYHLVLQGDSGKTMIGEIPNPDPTYVKNPAWLADIKTARDAVDKRVGGPLLPVDFKPEEMGPPTVERFAAGRPQKDEAPAMTQIGAHATITGVGFFDSSHGQTGVAPSAIELHPILNLVFK